MVFRGCWNKEYREDGGNISDTYSVLDKKDGKYA